MRESASWVWLLLEEERNAGVEADVVEDVGREGGLTRSLRERTSSSRLLPRLRVRAVERVDLAAAARRWPTGLLPARSALSIALEVAAVAAVHAVDARGVDDVAHLEAKREALAELQRGSRRPAIAEEPQPVSP